MAKGPDFSKTTIEILAKRAAQRCSNPGCQSITSGPHSEEVKAINLGEAAHIKGARPGFMRYDPSMTDAQRYHISNGIWLCRSCARMIDTDEARFPVELLYGWKREHERVIREGRLYSISYPWLETNSYLVENNEIKGLRLQVTVRDNPATSDAQHSTMTVSSLHNLKLEVWRPVAVGETGWHECQVGKVEVVEYNNHFPKILELNELKSNITVLVIVSSSDNAAWHSTVVLYHKGNHMDWEKYLDGIVKTPQGNQRVLVGEVCQNGVTRYTEGERINVTPELLIHHRTLFFY